MLSLVEISKFSKSMRNTSLKVIFSMREQPPFTCDLLKFRSEG